MELRRERQIAVIRDKMGVKIHVSNLLVGDILILSTGEGLPADAILIKGQNMRTDESKITNKGELARKITLDEYREDWEGNPFLVSGSTIVEGSGLAVVACVGEHSRIGGIRRVLEEKQAEGTPLQLKLERIADRVGIFGLWVGTGSLLALISNLYLSHNGGLWDIENLKVIMDYCILGISIIVVAIPEGLPLAVTIAIAFSVIKMKEENNLVRSLESCEIMAQTTNICTGKTGSLTMNDMCVESIYIQETDHLATNLGDLHPQTLTMLCKCICINSTAQLLHHSANGEEYKADSLDRALLSLSKSLGFDYRQQRTINYFDIPFSARRKRMTTVVECETDRSKVRIYVKGATELILERCISYMGANSELKKFNFQKKEDIKCNVYENYSKRGLKTLGLGYKDISKSMFSQIITDPNIGEDIGILEELEKNLVLIGVAGIRDKVREEARDTISRCRQAGIDVIMVTGDNLESAKYVARKAGILTQEDEKLKFSCMEGYQFKQLVGGILSGVNKDGRTEEYIAKIPIFNIICEQLKVLGRASPEDKYILITGLKAGENVVAVTGSGVHDAPSLRKSNVGFALGLSGTEVAKDSADILILDDNLSSILIATKWGRNIYYSIRKLLQFQLIVNIVAVLFVFIGSLFNAQSPLTALQLLWVNLIMDTFASLALATDSPTSTLLNHPPTRKGEFIICPAMWKNIILLPIYQLTLLSCLLFKGPQVYIYIYIYIYIVVWMGNKTSYRRME